MLPEQRRQIPLVHMATLITGVASVRARATRDVAARRRVPATGPARPQARPGPGCVALGSDPDRPVGADGPAGVVGDLPDVAVGVGEGPSGAAPLGLRGGPHDRGAGPLGLGEKVADLLGRADVVRELDPGSTVAAESGPQAE